MIAAQQAAQLLCFRSALRHDMVDRASEDGTVQSVSAAPWVGPCVDRKLSSALGWRMCAGDASEDPISSS